MSSGLTVLHSHSGIEREYRLPKNIVLIDTEFADLFPESELKPFKFYNRNYFKVDVLLFIKAGGVFKNLNI